MLTARGAAEDVLQGFEAGADDYLPKPFELTILIARVHGLLRRARMAAQRAAGRRAERQPAAATSHFAGRTIDFDPLEVRAATSACRSR